MAHTGKLLLTIAAGTLALMPLGSQAQTSQKPAFEAASVKRNTSRASGAGDATLGCHGTDSHSPTMIIPMGRCISKYEPLRLVVALAYDIPPALMYPYDGKVLSGPDW